MHKRFGTVVATASAAALTGGLLTLAAAPSNAASSRYADDFNGDGFRDHAVSAPGTEVGGHGAAGAVVITYGSAGGLQSAKTQVVTQSSNGVPGASEKDDYFGAVTAAGDYNSDGFADLAVGAPHEDTTAGLGSGENSGAVTVLWGGSGGLSGGTALEIPALDYPAGFGKVLTGGDFDGDGRHDLAVGQSQDNYVFFYRGGTVKTSQLGGRNGFEVTSMTKSSTGIESLASGDVNGDGTDDLVIGGDNNDTKDYFKQALYLSPLEPARRTYAGDVSHGATAAVADVDGDGYADIVTGHPRDPHSWMPGTSLGGNVTLTYGTSSGRDTSRPPVTITQDTAGIPGASEAEDFFGSAVALDDIDGDNRADLAVGAPAESIGSAEGTGSVTVIPGSAGGLATASAYGYNQDSAGVPGAAEVADYFGVALALKDTNGDRKADLAIGASGENGDGALWSLKGRAPKLTTTGAVSFGAATIGLPTSGYPDFGSSIAR
ncbi:FG-GAP-like repeat-containing protein [Streptomyces sp. NPDC055287]